MINVITHVVQIILHLLTPDIIEKVRSKCLNFMINASNSVKIISSVSHGCRETLLWIVLENWEKGYRYAILGKWKEAVEIFHWQQHSIYPWKVFLRFFLTSEWSMLLRRNTVSNQMHYIFLLLLLLLFIFLFSTCV